MKGKIYTSFEEINRDLKILRLQRQIDKEQLKLSVQETKHSFTPTQLLGGFSGIVQKLFLTLFIKKIAQRFS